MFYSETWSRVYRQIYLYKQIVNKFTYLYTLLDPILDALSQTTK